MKVTNEADYPVDVAGGRLLAPGDSVDVDEKIPHNQALIDAGVLSTAASRKKTTEEEKNDG